MNMGEWPRGDVPHALIPRVLREAGGFRTRELGAIMLLGLFPCLRCCNNQGPTTTVVLSTAHTPSAPLLQLILKTAGAYILMFGAY